MLLCHNGVAKCDGQRRTWQTSECMLIRRRGGRIRELCCDGKKRVLVVAICAHAIVRTQAQKGGVVDLRVWAGMG